MDGESAYIYVLFESRRKGFVDDVEAAIGDGLPVPPVEGAAAAQAAGEASA